jgi:hypothetical protein
MKLKYFVLPSSKARETASAFMQLFWQGIAVEFGVSAAFLTGL